MNGMDQKHELLNLNSRGIAPKVLGEDIGALAVTIMQQLLPPLPAKEGSPK